jgi:hypothetical protein
MEAHQDRANPYRSSLASSGPDQLGAAAPRRFPWRAVPATLLYVAGGSLLMPALAVLAVCVHRFLALRPRESVDRDDISVAIATVIALGIASLLLLAGWRIWKPRWWQGMLIGAMAIAIFAVMVFIFMGAMIGMTYYQK